VIAAPVVDDLLGAYEQSEIALELALAAYHDATACFAQARPADRRQADHRLSLATQEVLRQSVRRDRVRAQIAYARGR
jgi:hypothetical protein